MADRLVTFLIDVSKDEGRFEAFLKRPRVEMKKAGLSAAEIAMILTRNAKKIFQNIQAIAPDPVVYVAISKPPRRPASPKPRPKPNPKPKPKAKPAARPKARRR